MQILKQKKLSFLDKKCIENWFFYKNVMTKGRDDEMTKGDNGDKNVAKMHDEWSRIKSLEMDEGGLPCGESSYRWRIQRGANLPMPEPP